MLKPISEVSFEDIKKVYVGRSGCMCGCRGKYFVPKHAIAQHNAEYSSKKRANNAKCQDVLDSLKLHQRAVQISEDNRCKCYYIDTGEINFCLYVL